METNKCLIKKTKKFVNWCFLLRNRGSISNRWHLVVVCDQWEEVTPILASCIFVKHVRSQLWIELVEWNWLRLNLIHTVWKKIISNQIIKKPLIFECIIWKNWQIGNECFDYKTDMNIFRFKNYSKKKHTWSNTRTRIYYNFLPYGISDLIIVSLDTTLVYSKLPRNSTSSSCPNLHLWYSTVNPMSSNILLTQPTFNKINPINMGWL